MHDISDRVTWSVTLEPLRKKLLPRRFKGSCIVYGQIHYKRIPQYYKSEYTFLQLLSPLTDRFQLANFFLIHYIF